MSHEEPLPALATPHHAEVAVLGGGVVGLFTALQLARRGLGVTVIDDAARRRRSEGAGEPPLVVDGALLRAVGGLEELLGGLPSGEGVWFASGLEGAPSFAEASEWGVPADPGSRAAAGGERSCGASPDALVVGPDIEEGMRDILRCHPGITMVDAARVEDVAIRDDGGPHEVRWTRADDPVACATRAWWIIDCSGGDRGLARRLGHVVEVDDGFQTTAAWAVFHGAAGALFDERWTYTHKDGTRTPRDRCAIHLWGAGYSIRVLRLTGDRVGVGVTFDQRTPPPGVTAREQLWSVIRRYPVLRGALREEQMIDFRARRDAQRLTDTFVDARRYGITGDAASIPDTCSGHASSLSLVTSWHIVNIVERDLREGMLDDEYIDRVNRATAQDWEMMRNIAREKYSFAIEDGRFFALTHLFDVVVMRAARRTQSALARWLAETGGDTSRETAAQRRSRARLEERLYCSRAPGWGLLDPERVQRLQRRVQEGLAGRARFRLENGVDVPSLKSVLGPAAPPPALWRMAFVAGEEVADLSAAGAPGPRRLPGPAGPDGLSLLDQFALTCAYDWVDTRVRALRVWRRPLGATPV